MQRTSESAGPINSIGMPDTINGILIVLDKSKLHALVTSDALQSCPTLLGFGRKDSKENSSCNSLEPTAITLADCSSSSKKKRMPRLSESEDNRPENKPAASIRGGTRKWRLMNRSVVLPKSADDDTDERVKDMPLPKWVVPPSPKPTESALVTLLPGLLATTPPFTFRPPPGLAPLALMQQVDLGPL